MEDLENTMKRIVYRSNEPMCEARTGMGRDNAWWVSVYDYNFLPACLYALRL